MQMAPWVPVGSFEENWCPTGKEGFRENLPVWIETFFYVDYIEIISGDSTLTPRLGERSNNLDSLLNKAAFNCSGTRGGAVN